MGRFELQQFPHWLRHIAVALIYGLSFTAFKEVTVSHWIMIMVLRVACVLLLPYRYWPALLIGEEIPLTYANYLCLHPFGMAWFLFSSSVSPLGLAMLVVWGMHQWLPINGRTVASHMGALVVCLLVIALLNVGRNVTMYSLIAQLAPGDQRVALSGLAGRYFLGGFLPLMAFVPPILALREIAPWRIPPLEVGDHARRLLGPLALSLLVVAMVVEGHNVTGEPRRAIQLALFVPVMLSALWFGWRSAAAIGALASVSIMMLMPAFRDIGTLEAETLMAFTLSTVLMLGARTSSMHDALRRSEFTLARARHELYLNELKMRHGASSIEHELAFLSHTHSGLLHRLRHFLQASDEGGYRAQIIEARQRFFRLAESLAPREWLSVGDPSMLWTGSPLVEALEAVGVAYHVEPDGDLLMLAPDLNMALYRLGCEAVTYVLNHAPTDRVCIRTQTQRLPGGAWKAQVSVDSDGHPVPAPARDRLLRVLGATGLNLSDMQGRAALFDGKVKIEALGPTALRVTVWLIDKPASFGARALDIDQAPI